MCASRFSSFSPENGEQGECFFYKKNRYSSKFCQVTYSYRLKFLPLLVSRAGLWDRARCVPAGQAALDPLPVFEEDKQDDQDQHADHDPLPERRRASQTCLGNVKGRKLENML